jgi:hypothetical protein
MAESYVALPRDGTSAGKQVRSRQRTVGSTVVEEQYFIEQDERVLSFKGRASTYRAPGRAATQDIFALWNQTGSGVIVDVQRITVDVVGTVVKNPITVEAPLVRLVGITAIPTGGQTMVTAKTSLDTALTSANNVIPYQDATADRALIAGGGLTINPIVIISEEYGPRVIATAVGQEQSDCITFLGHSCTPVTLQVGVGIGVRVDIGSAGTNPATDLWTVTCEWLEYSLP